MFILSVIVNNIVTTCRSDNLSQLTAISKYTWRNKIKKYECSRLSSLSLSRARAKLSFFFSIIYIEEQIFRTRQNQVQIYICCAHNVRINRTMHQINPCIYKYTKPTN